MAYPTWQATGTAASATTGTLTVAWPTHLTDDIGLLCVEANANSPSLSTANGFAAIGSAQTNSGTTFHMFWCRATSNAMASPILTANTDHAFGVIVTFRNCISTGTPFENSGSNANAPGTSHTIQTGLFTTIPEQLIVEAMSKSLDSTAAFASGQTNSNLANITERFDAGTISGNGGGIALWHGEQITTATIVNTTVTTTATSTGYKSISLLPKLPSQTSFRFYEDGTETGSTAIDAQDTNITRVLSADSNLQLRIRIQNNQSVNQLTTDDYQLQYAINSTSYADIGSSSLIGNYDFLNSIEEFPGYFPVSAGAGYIEAGQSFTGNGHIINGVRVKLKKSGTPTGNAVIKIYAHTGTYGSSSAPAGSALATSDNFDVSTLTSTATETLINFSGGDQITLSNTTKYVFAFSYTGGDASNYVYVAHDSISSTHSGNATLWNGSTWTSDARDIVFEVLSTTAVIGFNSSSLTDGNATTNRLGAGTGSFVAGEICEDGLVDNHQITASNYTEYLYSLTLDSSEFNDTDAINFRVLRNDFGITYSTTPTITVSKPSGKLPIYIVRLQAVNRANNY